MVDLDALGQVRQLALEHGLDGGILVLGVVDQLGHDGGDVAGERPTAQQVIRCGPSGIHGDGEQLGSDGLVDVSVEIVGDPIKGERRGEFDDGHGGVLPDWWFRALLDGAVGALDRSCGIRNRRVAEWPVSRC